MRLLRSILFVSDRALRTFTPKTRARSVLLLAVAGLAMLAALRPAMGAALDTAMIERLTGARASSTRRKASSRSRCREPTSRYGRGRAPDATDGADLLGGVPAAGAHAMVMGDLVLLEDQVNPGDERRARQRPRGDGAAQSLLLGHAQGDVHAHRRHGRRARRSRPPSGKVFAKIRETSGGKGRVPRAEIDPAKTSLDPAKIDAVARATRASSKTASTRSSSAAPRRWTAPRSATRWASTPGPRSPAATTGGRRRRFRHARGRAAGVLKALRASGHQHRRHPQHMTGESPRVMFLHYWGVGPTQSLARGLKAALDTQRR